ncbi:uncharacterized protein EI97DRAFT_159401 [Westerdykella ornata]|uniref:Uncharacterized protein n=1 Tax=Westerdykella ornata TaxID=318751 RepID=A0A6A6JBA4_WESOR|nr:uncharacterized protein EI97DRAFT_159401 [Westerdykella ornata]KAF2273484.1 hypothetical protein EI97DRAFT_159401 [Westerdykella ornata]
MVPYSGATMRILVAILLASSNTASAAAVPLPDSNTDIHAREALPKNDVKTTLVSDADSAIFLSDLKEFLSRYDVSDVFADAFAKLFGTSVEGAQGVQGGKQQDTTTWDFFPTGPDTTSLVQTLVVEPVLVESFTDSSSATTTLVTIISPTTSEAPTLEPVSPEPTLSGTDDVVQILPFPFPIDTSGVSISVDVTVSPSLPEVTDIPSLTPVPIDLKCRSRPASLNPLPRPSRIHGGGGRGTGSPRRCRNFRKRSRWTGRR